MPELPEVQTVCDSVAKHLAGRHLLRAELLRDDIVEPVDVSITSLIQEGQRISLIRRGKRIVVCLDDVERFYIHLGMTGRLTCRPAGGERLLHTHLVLHLSDEKEVHFTDPRRFGGVFVLSDPTQATEGLGIDALDITWRQLSERLTRTRRNIKAALLDQQLIAGLGNIYVDESLFAAGLHPTTIANTLEEPSIKRLTQCIKRVLRKAINHRGSTLRDYVDAEGGKGAFQKLHNVYDRAGQPCRKCKTPIIRKVLGGRGTWICEQCQPEV